MLDSISKTAREHFANMVKYGKTVRGLKKNGLELWNSAKEGLPNVSVTWKPEAFGYYEKLRNLGVTGDDGDEKNGSWEPHHFLVQLGRIVKNNPEGNFIRLMQIAYNIGQLTCELELDEAREERGEQTIYTDEIVNFFDDNNLDSIESYVSVALVYDNQI